jgi:hypothetical protein
MESLAKILFDFDKLPSKLVLIICLLSGVILFVSPEFLAKIQLSKFNDSYGPWVGIAFMFSISFLVVTLITTLRNYIRKKNRYKGHEESITKSLNRLDLLEQSILREFFIANSTVNLPMDNATVVGLQDKGIIRLVQSNIGGYFVNGFDLPCTLTDFAKSVIERNPQLIGLPFDGRNMSDGVKQQLMETRPPWLRSRFGY